MPNYSPTRKDEINKWLHFIKNKEQLGRYKSRFRYKQQRDETLTEIFSAYFMEEKLGYRVIDWERTTINGKNADFVVSINGEEIYCEVKSPRWESELGKWERSSEQEKKEILQRKEQPKYGNKVEIRHVAPWEAYRGAIKRAYEKFIPSKRSLLIIVDDLFLSFYDFPTSIDQALFEDKGRRKSAIMSQKGYFVESQYENLGGVLFLNYTILGKVEYKTEFRTNPNALKPITNLVSVNSTMLLTSLME